MGSALKALGLFTEKACRDKHSSLFAESFGDEEEKKFYNIPARTRKRRKRSGNKIECRRSCCHNQ